MLFSISNQFRDKTPLSGNAWQSFYEVELTDKQFVNHVTNGGAFTPCLFHNSYRDTESFKQSSLIGIDCDQNTSMQEILAHQHSDLIWLVYETASSSPEYRKSRALIKLDNPIRDTNEYLALVRGALAIFADLNPDPNPKDAARIWYGSTNKDYRLVGNVVSAEQIKQLVPIIEPVKHPEPYKPKLEYKSRRTVQDVLKGVPSSIELRDLLSKIPPDDIPYDDWLSVLMAIHWCYPNSKGLEIAQDWTEHSCYRGELESKWKSFSSEKTDGVTVATIYSLAKKFIAIGVK